jgi:hypothetical protein
METITEAVDPGEMRKPATNAPRESVADITATASRKLSL